MADDPSNRGGQDRSRIATEQEHEVRYYTQALRGDQGTLVEAVKEVGNSADRVREYLTARTARAT